jgi:hypothetical protein
MQTVESTGSEAPAAPTLSLLARSGRIFMSPATAWGGLDGRPQWWIPMLLSLVLWLGLHALAYDHVTVPMMTEQWSDMVASGRLDAAQADKMSQFFQENPAARWFMLAQQAIIWPVLGFVLALVVWFGGGFVLGTRFRYRQALDVVWWSGLVKIPSTVLFFLLAWQRESFKGVHLGLGALLPESDAPTKLQAALGSFLDSIGPFEAWWLLVVILGAAALSGAPRRSIAWVFVALYLALGVFFAAVGAMFSPGT